MMQSGIYFGALVPPLHEQLHCTPEEVAIYQKQADAITLLAIHGTLTGTGKERSRKRLFKKIEKWMSKKLNIVEKCGEDE